jgi:hypothetical protein
MEAAKAFNVYCYTDQLGRVYLAGEGAIASSVAMTALNLEHVMTAQSVNTLDFW